VVELFLVLGLAVAVFVGFNIGGSSTGVAFGPAVGSGVLSKGWAAALMSAFALLGGLTLGRNVTRTMGGKIVPAAEFEGALVVSVAVLFFVGAALLVSNTFGVPASTSMTAVGAIAGLGAAHGTLFTGKMLEIVSYWIFAPIFAFWICAVVGRYFYPHLDARFPVSKSSADVVDFSGFAPRFGDDATTREKVSVGLIALIACYMAFSAGASNVANAVAPLVGGGYIDIVNGTLLAGAAIALGAFTIARRTLDTVGNDLTELPILAALIVEIVSASLITLLSYLGIPASLAVSATMCIVGLGWGRASRTVTVGDAVSGTKSPEVSVNALASDRPTRVPKMGEERSDDLMAKDLFDPSTVGRVVFFWMLTPILSAAASYALFASGVI
jgi:PiT family inorganic phosphate transporter